MKRFLSKILMFLALFLAANVIYLVLVRNVDWNYKKYLESIQAAKEGYEVIVLGNSLAMDGVNTEMLGNAYNLALGGASLETSLFQLREYFQKASVMPSTVLLGLGGNIDLKKEGLHPILAYTHGNKFDSFYDLPMLRFRWMAKELLKKVVSAEHRNAELVQGQLRIGRTMADRSSYAEANKTELNQKFYERIIELNEISELCDSAGVRFIVAELPLVKSEQNDIPLGPHSLSGYELYNFNNREFCEIFDAETHWLGGSHLNEKGAEVFTRELVKLIEF